MRRERARVEGIAIWADQVEIHPGRIGYQAALPPGMIGSEPSRLW